MSGTGPAKSHTYSGDCSPLGYDSVFIAAKWLPKHSGHSMKVKVFWITLKMEATNTSETSVTNYNQNSVLSQNIYRRSYENFKSHFVLFLITLLYPTYFETGIHYQGLRNYTCPSIMLIMKRWFAVFGV